MWTGLTVSVASDHKNEQRGKEKHRFWQSRKSKHRVDTQTTPHQGDKGDASNRDLTQLPETNATDPIETKTKLGGAEAARKV